MFIQNLHIDRFGSVANLALDNLTAGVSVIQGGPGTGKTTLLQFARAILYGFDDPTRSRYLPATSSDACGGSLTWTQGHHQYTIRRHDDGQRNGHVEVSGDGQPLSRAVLSDTLQGISADLYARLFAVDFSRRPDVTGLLEEADKCGLGIEGQTVDTVKLQELKRRLATLQATLSALGPIDQSPDSLQLRRRELLDDIVRLELEASHCQEERGQTQGKIDALQRQQDASREELRALRHAIDEIAPARQDCRGQLARAEAAAANGRSQATGIDELNARIQRWKNVLQEAASRYEELGQRGLVAAGVHPHVDDFEANLVALDTCLRELELTSTPDRTGSQSWEQAEISPKLQVIRQRLSRLRGQLGRPAPTQAATNCDCQRKQLTRTQAELQISLRYLEAERDAVVADGRVSQDLIDEVVRLKQQLKHYDAKEAELQQRFDTVTLLVRQQESELAGLLRRLHGLADDLAQRLAAHREKLQHVEHLLSEVERRQTLVESIADTQRQIRATERGSGESATLLAATNYLRRFSADGLQRIEVTHGKHVWVADAQGHRLSWGHLSEAARDKVYLSLCLALVEAHNRRSPPLPLIWKDVFTNFDSRHVPEAAELLRSFARDGRQLLLVTRHEHVASVFRSINVPIRQLAAGRDRAAIVTAPQRRPAIHDVNHWLAVAGDEEATAIDPAWEAGEANAGDAEFHLFDVSPIEQSPSVSSDNAVRLRRIGIMTVGDLLDAAAEDIAADLSYAGISSRMVANWQAQALMMCGVARLREYDARILVACGITSPRQLRRIPPLEVRAMIERFAESPEGRAMLLSGTEFELSRVTNWVRTEQAAAGPRQQGTRQIAKSSSRDNSRASSGDQLRLVDSKGRSAANSAGREPTRAGHRQAQPQDGGASQRRSDGRALQREHEQADVVKMKSTVESADLQFHLNRDAGVVDAPSIGPRTAERLEAAGIVTVADLLAGNAADMARRLKNKRMSAALIRQWQQQTELVCRVPCLRGHDAQILVAVGVTDADELAAMDPQDLWALVEPFVESTAGKRLIRSSKAPDFEEVFHWIEWAGQARALNAA